MTPKIASHFLAAWRKGFIKAFAEAREATVATAFAVMAPVLIGATGMALDLGQAYLVKQRLGGALDAATLAATSSATTQSDIEALVNEYMEANYPESKIGNLVLDSVDVAIDGDDVTVSANAVYETSFIRLLGIDTITVAESVTVHRAIRGLEAVLVLDNTGSMGDTNIAHLKTAATNFVDIIFDRAQSGEDVRIGIVPYSSSVRIGYYGLGKVPDDAEYDANGVGGTYQTYGDGSVFVTLPAGVNYITRENRDGDGTNDNLDGWYGCVVEHEDTNYDSTAKHVVTTATATLQGGNARGQLWSTNATGSADEFKCNNAGTGKCAGHGWDPAITSNDPDPDDSEDNWEGPWDIYQYGKIVSSGNECTGSGYSYQRCSACNKDGIPGSSDRDCTQSYCYCWNSNPNSSCPWAYIQPLTSDQDQLLSIINSMDDEGSTYSNIGMAWGKRLLSPEKPFTEGVAWDNREWKKAVVMMTDGEMSPSGTYSSYWASNKTSTDNVNTLNDRLLDICTDLKSKGVVIYTINFKHASSDIDSNTMQIYKDCATQPWQDYYKYVETGEELNAMFEEIAAALARLHISH